MEWVNHLIYEYWSAAWSATFPLRSSLALLVRREQGGRLPGSCVANAVSQPESFSQASLCSVKPMRVEASELPSFPQKILTLQATRVKLRSREMTYGLEAKALFLALPALLCSTVSGIWDPCKYVLEENSIRIPFAAEDWTCVELLYKKDIFNSSLNRKYSCLLKTMEILKFSENQSLSVKISFENRNREQKRWTGRANRYRNIWKQSGQTSIPTSAPVPSSPACTSQHKQHFQADQKAASPLATSIGSLLTFHA